MQYERIDCVPVSTLIGALARNDLQGCSGGGGGGCCCGGSDDGSGAGWGGGQN